MIILLKSVARSPERFDRLVASTEAAAQFGCNASALKEIRDGWNLLIERAYDRFFRQPFTYGKGWQPDLEVASGTFPAMHNIVGLDKKLAKVPQTPAIVAARSVIIEALPVVPQIEQIKARVAAGVKPAKVSVAKPSNPNQIRRTCPCCFREVAVVSGLMAHHGYKRPGYGYQTQSCMGVHYAPLERSDEGLRAVIAMCQRTVAKLGDDLAGLNAATSLTIPGRNGRSEQTVERGTPAFSRENERRAHAINLDLRYYTEALAYMEQRLSVWAATE